MPFDPGAGPDDDPDDEPDDEPDALEDEPDPPPPQAANAKEMSNVISWRFIVYLIKMIELQTARKAFECAAIE